jgi:tRNA(fMet)-specific endonuclease VapC
MIYLLDTNAWVVFLRNPHSPIVSRLRARRPDEIRVCSVVVAELYYIRHHLESRGAVIGPNDLQIAAIALANGCVLVSHNTKEFGRVPSLMLEDWELP